MPLDVTAEEPFDADLRETLPHLAWVAVWNRDIIVATGKRVESDSNNEQESSKQGDSQENNRDEDEAAGILCALPGPAFGSLPVDKEVLARRIGLAQGLLDFTRSLSHNAGVGVNVVYSQNQRLVFIEPEDHFLFVAAFRHDAIQPVHSTAARTRLASAESAKTANSSDYGHTPSAHKQAVPTSDLIDGLWRMYWQFRLLHGDLLTCLTRDGAVALKKALRSFVSDPLGQASIGTPSVLLQSPLVASLKVPVIDTLRRYGLDSVAMIHQSGILQLDDSSYAHSDSLAVAQYLQALLPSKSIAPVENAEEKYSERKARLKPTAKRNDDHSRKTSASWKNLGLGGIGNYISMPAMPNVNMTIPGIGMGHSVKSEEKSTAPIPHESSAAAQDGGALADSPSSNASATLRPPRIRETSAGWMPAFNLFSKPKVAETTVSTLVTATPPSHYKAHETAAPHQVYNDVAAEATAFSTRSRLTTPEPPEHSLGVAENSPKDQNVMSDSINDAMCNQQPVVSSSSETPAPSLPRLEAMSTQRLFLGSPGRWNKVKIFRMETLACALSCGDDVDGTRAIPSAALVEACLRDIIRDLSVAETTQPPAEAHKSPIIYCQPRYVSDTAQSERPKLVQVNNSASSSTSRHADRLGSDLAAVEQLRAFSTTTYQELFLRTSGMQWLSARLRKKLREDAGNNEDVSENGYKYSQVLDIRMLPKSTGKEGSLVDVDLEVSRQVSEQLPR